MDKIKLAGLDSLQYVVQEKVHGANCCLVTDGQTVHFAKRTRWVEPDETFYQHEKLLERYKEKAIHLFSGIRDRYADTISISVS